ncbi:MAG: VOC family protein [Bauldia sp.]|nr:VOC family protein [Bauldia sp.]
MKIIAYLFFPGTCAEACRFYEKALGARIVAMMPHAGTPAEPHVPAEWRDKIMHARLAVGDAEIMASDSPPDHQKTPQGFAVSLHVESEAEAERVFKALAEGGTVTMAMAPTFWAKRFGMLTDRFGIPWMVNCDAAPA